MTAPLDRTSPGRVDNRDGDTLASGLKTYFPEERNAGEACSTCRSRFVTAELRTELVRRATLLCGLASAHPFR